MKRIAIQKIIAIVLVAIYLLSMTACTSGYENSNGASSTTSKPVIEFSSKSRETIYYMVEEAYSTSVAKECIISLNDVGLADILTNININSDSEIHAVTDDKYGLDVTIKFDELKEVQIYISKISPQAILTLASYIKFTKVDDFYTACICDGGSYGVYDTEKGTITDAIGRDLIIAFDKDIQDSTSNISQPGVIKSNPIIVTVDEFAKEINTNISKAKEKYNGKYIKITGNITQIVDGGIMTGYYIYGKRGDSGLRVICWQDGDQQKGVIQGKSYTFLGKIQEITKVNATEISECTIITN